MRLLSIAVLGSSYPHFLLKLQYFRTWFLFAATSRHSVCVVGLHIFRKHDLEHPYHSQQNLESAKLHFISQEQGDYACVKFVGQSLSKDVAVQAIRFFFSY